MNTDDADLAASGGDGSVVKMESERKDVSSYCFAKIAFNAVSDPACTVTSRVQSL